jgi:hypothetical protein
MATAMHALSLLLLWLSLPSLTVARLETPLLSLTDLMGSLIESHALVRVRLAPLATIGSQVQRTPRPSQRTPGTNLGRERAYEYEEEEPFDACPFCSWLSFRSRRDAASGGVASFLLLGGMIEWFEHLGSVILRC